MCFSLHREFNETMNSLDKQCPGAIRLSSAGLIYFHFGRRVICELIRRLPPPPADPTAGDTSQLENLHRAPDPEHPMIRALWLHLYRSLIQELDAIDNGVNIAPETKFVPLCCLSLMQAILVLFASHV